MLKKDKAESEQTALSLRQALIQLQEQRKEVESDLKDSYSGKMLDRSLRSLDNALNESLEELVTLSGNKNPHALSNTLRYYPYQLGHHDQIRKCRTYPPVWSTGLPAT